MPSPTPRLLTLLTLLLSIFSSLSLAQEKNPSIYKDTKDGYAYHGCYSETTDVEGATPGARALYNGKNQVKPGEMTVQMCQAFCKGNDDDGKKGSSSQYKYAGVEFATECWCAQQISGLSTKLDDAECNIPCDGDKSQACGGTLKLTVYTVAAGASLPSINAMWVAGLTGVAALLLV